MSYAKSGGKKAATRNVKGKRTQDNAKVQQDRDKQEQARKDLLARFRAKTKGTQ